MLIYTTECLKIAKALSKTSNFYSKMPLDQQPVEPFTNEKVDFTNATLLDFKQIQSIKSTSNSCTKLILN